MRLSIVGGPYPQEVEFYRLVELKYEKRSKECISWIASTLHRATRSDTVKGMYFNCWRRFTSDDVVPRSPNTPRRSCQDEMYWVAVARRRFSLVREMRYLGRLCQRHNLAKVPRISDKEQVSYLDFIQQLPSSRFISSTQSLWSSSYIGNSANCGVHAPNRVLEPPWHFSHASHLDVTSPPRQNF